MAMFVHLAPESRIALIRRNGIRRLRRTTGSFPGGVFAVPVTRNFYVSHQWLRELKRRNRGPIAGVYFRVPDTERVWVGHYNQGHRRPGADSARQELTGCRRPGYVRRDREPLAPCTNGHGGQSAARSNPHTKVGWLVVASGLLHRPDEATTTINHVVLVGDGRDGRSKCARRSDHLDHQPSALNRTYWRGGGVL
jgi:hypothetical protein